MPGNAGGAKDPDFWCAFDDGEVKVIGDEPWQRLKRSGPFRESSIAKRRRSPPVLRTLAPSGPVVCLAVKPAGKPDAGNRHVRFDERGWETGRWPTAQATAPILDSTIAVWRPPSRVLGLTRVAPVRDPWHSPVNPR